MKTLLILRHAKAQPDAPRGDWARELTKRGRRDAATVGDWVRGSAGRPDAVVASDAQRARQTAEIVAEAVGFDAALTLEPEIYGAGVATLLRVVRGLPDEAACVLLVGHNPGLEELTAVLADADVAEVRLPTAALAHLELSVGRWREVGAGRGRLRGISTPREPAG